MKKLWKKQKVEKGVYYPTIIDDLEREDVKKFIDGKTLLDLGCGDGRVVEWARKNGCKSYGIEWDDRVEESHYIVCSDMFWIDWGDFDVLYYYVAGCDEEDRVIKKMAEEARAVILYTKDVDDSCRVKRFTDKLKVPVLII